MVHGGNVQQAAQHYQLAVEEWLDLSTGINPFAYSDLSITHDAHTKLPYIEQGFLTAARDYYNCEHLGVVAGSQQAIQLLPLLRERSKVAVLSPTYSEHVLSWQHAGHAVTEIHTLDDTINYDVVVVTNPNNPTGRVIDKSTLINIHQQLQSRGGWLIVDEAFVDCNPEHSLAYLANQSGLIILRSIGKFFGLAGLRVGFVIAEAVFIKRLSQLVGHWPLSGAAQQITQQCLQDKDWQHAMRTQLVRQSQQLGVLLSQSGFVSNGQTSLFHWVVHEEAADIHDALAGMGILARYFPENTFSKSSLRFGLPGSDASVQRLQHALELIT